MIEELWWGGVAISVVDVAMQEDNLCGWSVSTWPFCSSAVRPKLLLVAGSMAIFFSWMLFWLREGRLFGSLDLVLRLFRGLESCCLRVEIIFERTDGLLDILSWR